MLDLEQSFKSVPPRENLSKAVNPAGFRAFDPFSKDSRCNKMQSVADGKRRICPYQLFYFRAFCPNRMGVMPHTNVG